MKIAIPLSILILTFPVCLSAQDADSLNTGIIDGTVNDESGNPMIGAAIIAFDENDSTFGAMTDATGYYEITGLPPGDYTIRAFMAGMDFPTEDVFIDDENDSIKEVTIEYSYMDSIPDPNVIWIP